jgi:hypothetical protein
MGLNELRTVRQAAKETPFSENTIRWWIFQAPENGFENVMRRVGGRIFIDLAALGKWIEGGEVTTRDTGE